jgi:anti-anti-sigma regulatory factor
VRIPVCAIDEQVAITIQHACAGMRAVTAIDFRNVRFINSGGLAALLKFSVAARKKGYKLFATNLSAHHQKMFKQVEIARFMPIVAEHELLGSDRARLLNVATEIPAAT